MLEYSLAVTSICTVVNSSISVTGIGVGIVIIVHTYGVDSTIEVSECIGQLSYWIYCNVATDWTNRLIP